jgi:MoaA/NifB/PqqE/SkfB family radical SAM enzyme/membrane protein YqaA with SNARE-associated domain
MKADSQYQFDRMTPLTWAFGALIVLLGVIGVYMMSLRTDQYPLLTIFLYSIPSNCAIAIFPHEPVLILYSKTVNLWMLSIMATLGTLLAAFLDYRFFSPLLNLSYSAKYKSHRYYRNAHKWFYRLPFWSLVVAGFTPIPFYPFKFMVYASKYPLWRYLSAVAAGRFPRYLYLSALGYIFQIPNWIILGSFLGMFLLVYSRKVILWIKKGIAVLLKLASWEKIRAGGKTAKNIPVSLAVRMAARTAGNMILKRPICIALEVTHNCTANCRHCDKGAKVDDHARTAEEYARICKELSPAMIQIAGGEPLWRTDLVDIVKALYKPNHPPFLVIVTNASLLTKEKYLELREAGVRQFSISLDFPDERHDDFRRIPGLFKRLEKLAPELLAEGHGDITLNTCITRENYPYIKDIARLATKWGAKLNFSAYTDLRTHDDSFNLRHPEDTSRFSAIISDIFNPANGEYRSVMTSEKVLRRFNRFYEEGKNMPDCRTGERFLIVNPDGRLTPCAMFIGERYASRQELMEKFAANNACGGCYISIRANTEKSVWELFTDNLRALRLSRAGDGQN